MDAIQKKETNGGFLLPVVYFIAGAVAGDIVTKAYYASIEAYFEACGNGTYLGVGKGR